MPLQFIRKNKLYSGLPLLMVMVCLLIGLFTLPLSAQNEYRNLILSDQYDEHFLSPYLARYTEQTNINDVRDIVFNPSAQSEILPVSGSIILLGLNEETNWLTFDVINRSTQTDWFVDFGTSYEGRFGFFASAKAFTFNRETSKLKEHVIGENKNIQIYLPTDQKTQILLQLDKSESLPITTPLRLLNAHKNAAKSFGSGFFISTIFLIGMAFFFVAVSIMKYNYSYLFLSLYYLCFTLLLFAQNNNVSFDIFLIGNQIHSYLIFIIATATLIIANFFWHPGRKEFWTNQSFFIPFGLGLAVIIIGHFVNSSTHLLNLFLLVGPSLIMILVIPLVCITQGQAKHENITPFMLGCFILLFGICISILALSGVLQPVSSAINAYWFALVPQAFFFIVAAQMDVSPENERFALSKTLEIDESDSVTKLRQTKENTEQERLLKVIEQERRVLNELRKSEARQTEEMRKAKEIADEANKGKSNFLAVVSHEIRTPMTGIMGMVRMLLNSNLTREQNEYANTIQDSSNAMLSLLNDILDFEKIEQGKMTVENISFDLHRLVKGVSTLMRGHAVQKKIELSTKTGDDLPQFVMGDPTRLRQVLLNLTGNAVKFTEEGNVKITAELMKENTETNSYEIYFSVTDNGIGISEKAKKDLFSPFSQADKTISRKFGGTGLGLAISKGLISNMGSEINISSTEGEGSTFFFTLNMAKGEKKSQESTQNVMPATDKIKAKKILLVDDNHINRKVVHGLLAELPYEIEDAENAEDGLDKLKFGKFDLVLMDIELPDMNGDEATQKIRRNSDAAIKDIPVIALTGNTQDEHIHHYYDCGINSFIAKPIDPSALIKTIENAANGIFGSQTRKRPQNIIQPEISIEPTDLELDTNKGDILTAPEEKEESIEMDALPEIKPIIEGTPKKIPSFSNTISNKELPTIKNENANKDSTTPNNNSIDIETLDSLRKHLPQEKMKEMIDDVLQKTDEIISDLKSAAEEKDIEIMNAKCHDLKGMTGNFGLQEISDIAKEIEQKAKTQPSIIIATLISTLPDAKKRAEEALSQYFTEDTLDI